MATITYATDVAPHLRRGLRYRQLRMQRWQVLHAHDYERYDEYDPYSSAKKARFFDLLVYLAVIVFFAAGSGIAGLFKSGSAPRH